MNGRMGLRRKLAIGIATLVLLVGALSPLIAGAKSPFYKPKVPSRVKSFRTSVELNGMTVYFPDKMSRGYRVKTVRLYEQDYVEAAYDSGPACEVTFRNGPHTVVLRQTPRQVVDVPPTATVRWGSRSAELFNEPPHSIVMWRGDYSYSLYSADLSTSRLKVIAKSMKPVKTRSHLWLGEVHSWSPKGVQPRSGTTRFRVVAETDGEPSRSFRASNRNTKWMLWENSTASRTTRNGIDRRLRSNPNGYGVEVTWRWAGKGDKRYRYAWKVKLTDYSNAGD